MVVGAVFDVNTPGVVEKKLRDDPPSHSVALDLSLVDSWGSREATLLLEGETPLAGSKSDGWDDDKYTPCSSCDTIKSP